ncbi:aminomethyl-transferring glycine dehydrogenase [Marinilabiliaceae bacterium ANBcel2]|nr:aminomethyl-transferring glycine dehydrogenase [Marinilabiliaceae bacterium ANBcel2]
MRTSDYIYRHIGPDKKDVAIMLDTLGVSSVDQLIDEIIPQSIKGASLEKIGDGISEADFLSRIKELASKNKMFRSYIGMGYYNTITPSVIIRNVLENPVWYTSYTPYQAEISQGRLEALLNFQTVITELTAMDVANASLLDEATAAAEALVMMYNNRSREQRKKRVSRCVVDFSVWPQTRAVLETRAEGLGIELKFGDITDDIFEVDKDFGMIAQYPRMNGDIADYSKIVKKVHKNGGKTAIAADLLALTLLTPPGEWGADIVFGSAQRLGVPMAYGGPHAGYFAVKEELKRAMPGRIIGVSKDTNGKPVLRMALQTREQHIRREKATSNICTAQALLATMSGFYAVYHGPQGLKNIALQINGYAATLKQAANSLGYVSLNDSFFDTLRFRLPNNLTTKDIKEQALLKGINFFYSGVDEFSISVDETTCEDDIKDIVLILSQCKGVTLPELNFKTSHSIEGGVKRESDYMNQQVFWSYHSETEMMRYIKQLERKDFSLAHSMISLGSCTMKLNAATAMFPITWPEFSQLHPFIPVDQAEGYHMMMRELRHDLSIITGFEDVTLQPNSGASGEYTGLMIIRAYHESRGEGDRKKVLIPSSAHGTNPASAVMAGMEVEVVKCDNNGNVDIDDLKVKIEKNRDLIAAIMITYPSTHGVFESSVANICRLIHEAGGQVYMDGANMNAQTGLTSPGRIGADVCHLNLHKTFAIPHGGGGPGVGPVGVAKHLTKFLPAHPVVDNRREGMLTVASAPWGSAGILPITYGYIKMMGKVGLKKASEIAILNANYIAEKLKDGYGIVYKGENGRVAHELILECREIKRESGITETDIAKRLIDYGFHAPTLSFPVPGTLMIEPTESESLKELDRFIEAMLSILNEIDEVNTGKYDKENNVLKNAPHPDYVAVSDNWEFPYSREKAVFPLPYLKKDKFWITVSRVDNAFGDRNLICTCDSFFQE